MVPWYHGAMAPWHHGTMMPWHHGTMSPWYHGFIPQTVLALRGSDGVGIECLGSWVDPGACKLCRRWCSNTVPVHKNRPHPSKTHHFFNILMQVVPKSLIFTIQNVTQPSIRSQGYAAKVTQPRLRPRLRSQACTARVTSATVTLPRSSCSGYTSKVA